MAMSMPDGTSNAGRFRWMEAGRRGRYRTIDPNAAPLEKDRHFPSPLAMGAFALTERS
jgi:hypothetical protein